MRPEKQAIINEIKGRIENSGYVFLTDFRGLTVQRVTDLRSRLKGADSRVMVVSNTLLGQASKQLGWKGLDPYLSGPTAMITGRGDVRQVAKILVDYTKEFQLPVLKGGRVESTVIGAADVTAIAMIPPREILLGQFLGLLVAPMSQLAGVLSQKLTTVVYALKAVIEKKEKA